MTPITKPPIKKPPSAQTWTTKEGKDIPIGEMENSHIENTIAFLERKLKKAAPDDWEQWEDWEDGPNPPARMPKTRVYMRMFIKERERRIGEHKWTLAVNEKIRIAMAGPGLEERIV